MPCLLPLLAAAQPAPPATPASAPEPAPQRVEVTGSPARSDTEQRRQSTAGKLVVGREEIERYGDGNTSDVLRRLPGVTVQGTAGREGTPRLRGLGSGYTQILVDGEPLPEGFSVDALSPAQLERIELLRGPTAETGARAIAGTINIVTRENQRRPLSDWRLAGRLDGGRLSPSAVWTRSDRVGEAFDYTSSVQVYGRNEANRSTTTRVSDSVDQRSQLDIEDHRSGLRGNGRLRWRLGDGEHFTLSPFVLLTASEPQRHGRLADALQPPPYERFDSLADGSFTLGRLNGQLNRRVGDSRVEWSFSASGSRWGSDITRQEAGGARPRDRFDDVITRSRSASTKLKSSTPIGEAHSLVVGGELERLRRQDRRGVEVGGQRLIDDRLEASTSRWAVYAQDEWVVGPRLDLQLGLRGEGITTRATADGARGTQLHHRSSVWTPLLHAVWRLDDSKRDQLRLSLTRSYRAPALNSLIAQRAINGDYPTGKNTPTNADRVGNPALRPEIATGVELGVERYLAGGGLVSANLFHRRIRDLMRDVTREETVSWSDEPRWVSRPINIGNATTTGLELEARFRLDQVIAQAPAVDLRSNLSLFRSRVESVPGPDDRLDQQPDATLNLGADYRFAGLPLTVGGTLNITPGFDSRIAEQQWARQGRKRVFDAYALWRVSPSVSLRLSAGNLLPLDESNEGSAFDETARTVARTTTSWQLQLEMKL